MTAAAAALIATTAGLAWLLAGGRGCLYLLLYTLATLPGWPIGWKLFGRRHAAGWVAAGLFGYALTAVAWSVAIRLGFRSGLAFLSVWAGLAVTAWIATRPFASPLVKLPAWARRDTTALLLVLLLVPALVGPPFANVGARDEAGNRLYRAYFTADFLWHEALTAELTRFVLPPSNPYLADQTLHYYWTSFVPSAVAAGTLGTRGRTVEECLKISALSAGLLFVAAIFMATWCAVPRGGAAALAVTLTVVASSAQGLYALYDLYERGRPLAGVRDLNIQAMTAWLFQGLRIDGLQRSLWYVPQHAGACALGLVALVVAGSAGAAAPLGAIAAAGLALGLSLVFSPLLGAAFALIYGLTIVIDAARRSREILLDVGGHLIAAAVVAVALAWCQFNQMFEGAGAALHFGHAGPATRAPLRTFILAFGPLLIPALAGLWPWRGLPSSARPALVTLLVGFWLMYFVVLLPDQFWVGFRAGQIILIALPVFAARFFARAFADRRLRWAGVAVAIVVFSLGAPTTAIDAYNAQDISNRAMGPGFHWTITITAEEQAAFEWLKRATPRDAVVQMDPIARGRETWTLIPTFAERRMAAGLPISLLNTPEYQERSERVKTIYAGADATAAWRVASELGIDYLYVDRVERAAYPAEALAKLDRRPEYFAPVFRNAEVAIYAVSK